MFRKSVFICPTPRGAKFIARALRDEGFEVIYTGIRRTPEEIASAAIQEDVAAIGLSSLSGAHLRLFPAVVDALKTRGVTDIPVIGGGVIPTPPQAAHDEMLEYGFRTILYALEDFFEHGFSLNK